MNPKRALRRCPVPLKNILLTADRNRTTGTPSVCRALCLLGKFFGPFSKRQWTPTQVVKSTQSNARLKLHRIQRHPVRSQRYPAQKQKAKPRSRLQTEALDTPNSEEPVATDCTGGAPSGCGIDTTYFNSHQACAHFRE